MVVHELIELNGFEKKKFMYRLLQFVLVNDDIIYYSIEIFI